MAPQTVLNFRAEPELVDVVKSIAEDNNVDLSEACRMLIREGLRSVTMQYAQLAEADPRFHKRHHPTPLDDAILAVKLAMQDDRQMVERVLVTGRSVQSGVLLAYLSAALLKFTNEDPETVLDKWGDQTRARIAKKQLARRARAVARGQRASR